jgi:hypothetical protein
MQKCCVCALQVVTEIYILRSACDLLRRSKLWGMMYKTGQTRIATHHKVDIRYLVHNEVHKVSADPAFLAFVGVLCKKYVSG